MRRALTIVGIIVGGLIIAVVAVLLVAAANLNSIIAERRGYLLQRASNALGRDVQVTDITATLGWGVMADLQGVKIADDPALSQKPFVEASDLYATVDLVPLLSRQLHVTELTLKNPEIRIIRGKDGRLNVASIGKKSNKNPSNAAPAPGREKSPKGPVEGGPMEESSRQPPAALSALFVKDFLIEGGKIVYTDQQAGAAPIKISHIDLKVATFSFDRPFDLTLDLAALSDQQNLNLTAKVGPIVSGGAIDPTALPFSAKARLGPLTLAQIRTFASAAQAIPEKLAMPEPFSLDADASGTLDSTTFDASTDLSSNSIAFGDSLNKPGGVPLKLAANGTRIGSALDLKFAELNLGDLDLKASNIKTGGGKTAARIDTNRFDLAALGKIVPALAKLNVGGKAEIHSGVEYAGSVPTANGTVALDQVTVTRPGQSTPLVSALTGDVKLAGTTADVGPLSFNFGSSHAKLTARAQSLQPLRAQYNFSADTIKLAEFIPSRPADEQLTQLTTTGSVAMMPQGPNVDTVAFSPAGSLANVTYRNLSAEASLRGHQATIKKLKVGAFGGTILATGNAGLDADGLFNAAIDAANIDLQQALESQKSKAAGMIRGSLNAVVNVAGSNAGSFDQIKPTLKGNGRLAVANGKLVGVNVASDALKKVNNIPAVGTLVPASVVQNHPELFGNPDTDIQEASLTFQLQGPRVTTHDLLVKTVDYSLLGDGWFDMDKNVDLAARILLSKQLSQEIIAQNDKVMFVSNRDGQVDIPLRVQGALPKPKVLPDVAQLAQTAGQQAVSSQGQKYINKYLGKNKGLGKALGKFLGGGGSDGGGADGSGGGAPAGQATPASNPLDNLKNFFR
ncbi:MAG TPA: AsmA-like C-terminal domain-containing protein [Candidatus Binataceae bacterium]